MRTVKGGARRWVGLTMLAVLAGLAAALLLRDQVSLLTTHGSSMHPHFRTGDLAITVLTDSYRVGDIAAYRAEPNGSLVLHRIVESKGGRLTFKGDNNDWTDPTHPRPDQLVGKLWVRIPGAGVIADYSSAPGRTVLLIGGVTLLVAGEGARRRTRRGRSDDDRPRRARATRPTAPAPSSADDAAAATVTPTATPRPGLAGWADAASALSGPVVATAVALVLAVISFTHPAMRDSTAKRTFTQEVTYGYTGTAPTGTTYPDGAVTTGSPIFLRLVQQIDFQIAYRLEADAPIHNAAGRYSIDAELSGVGSWKRTIELQPSTHFSGPGFSTQVTLDVAQIQALVDATQAETGVKGDNLVIELVPRVTTNGFAGGVPVSGTFDTPMRLKLTPLDITPIADPDQRGDGLGTSTSTDYRAPVQRVRRFTFVGRTITVARAQFLSVVALIAALGWLGFALDRQRRLRREHPAIQLAQRYQSSIVEVSSAPAVGHAVDVTDMAALVRIAERCDRLILHHREGADHTFLVEDDVTTYRLRISDGATVPTATPDPAPEPAAESPPGTEPITEPIAEPEPITDPEPIPPDPVAIEPDPEPEPIPPDPVAIEPAPMPEPTPVPEPEPHPVAGLLAASEDTPAEQLFRALLGGGFPAAPEYDPGTPPPFTPAPDPAPAPDFDAGNPPPYFGTPASEIRVETLDDALKLTPLSDTERDELGVGDERRAERDG